MSTTSLRRRRDRLAEDARVARKLSTSMFGDEEEILAAGQSNEPEKRPIDGEVEFLLGSELTDVRKLAPSHPGARRIVELITPESFLDVLLTEAMEKLPLVLRRLCEASDFWIDHSGEMPRPPSVNAWQNTH